MFLELIFSVEELLYPFVRLVVFLSVFLQIAIEVKAEVEVKLVLILEGLPLLSIEVCPIDVDVQILWLISDKGRFPV